MAIDNIVREIMWVIQILNEMHIKVNAPSIVYVDNQSAITISNNDVSHDRTKHMAARYFYVRDLIKDNIIKLEWVSTQHQLADIFTKGLGGPIFINFREKLLSRLK